VSIISDILFICENKVKLQLQNNFLELLKDKTKEVKVTAIMQIGSFISLLEGHDISQKLIDAYFSMAKHKVYSLLNDDSVHTLTLSFIHLTYKNI
jgi:hypothetical protein